MLGAAGCTNYYNTSYIRIKEIAPEKYRVYFGSQEAIKYGFEDTPELRKALEPQMKALQACKNGFKLAPNSLSGSGQSLQSSFVIECIPI